MLRWSHIGTTMEIPDDMYGSVKSTCCDRSAVMVMSATTALNSCGHDVANLSSNPIFWKPIIANSWRWPSFILPIPFGELQNYMFWGGKNEVLLEML